VSKTKNEFVIHHFQRKVGDECFSYSSL